MTKFAGLFQPESGNLVFTDGDQSLFRWSAEIHEAAHAQLHHSSHFGALFKNVSNFRRHFVTDHRASALLAGLEELLWNAMVPVQEGIATFAGVAALVQESERFRDYTSFLPPEYCQYVEPLAPLLKENLSWEHVTASVNLGLLALNSPIFDLVASVDPPDMTTYAGIIDHAAVSPIERLHSITETMDRLDYSLGDLHPGSRLRELVDFLIQQRIMPFARAQLEEDPKKVQAAALKEHALLVESPLFALDSPARNRYEASVEFIDGEPELEDFVRAGTIFLRRDVRSPRTDKEVLSAIKGILSAPDLSRGSHVLELRSEDLVMSGSDGSINKLTDSETIIQHFAEIGEPELSFWGTAPTDNVEVLVREFKKRASRSSVVLMSSQEFDFARGRWKSKKIPRPAVVVCPQGSTEVVVRTCVAMGRRWPKLRAGSLACRLITMDQASDQMFLVIVRGRLKDGVYMLVPTTETVAGGMVEVCSDFRIRNLSDEEVEGAEFSPVRSALAHLAAVGWAPETESSEDPRILIPGTRHLTYAECTSRLEKWRKERWSMEGDEPSS